VLGQGWGKHGVARGGCKTLGCLGMRTLATQGVKTLCPSYRQQFHSIIDGPVVTSSFTNGPIVTNSAI
jgi:hypothetical protein